MELQQIIERVSKRIIVERADKHGSYYAYRFSVAIGKILRSLQGEV